MALRTTNNDGFDPAEIEEALDKSSGVNSDRLIDIRLDLIKQLENRHYWEPLTKQITREEQKFFKEEWKKLIIQFSGSDIVYTDEMTIRELAYSNIMLNRTRTQRQELLAEIKSIKKQVAEEMKLPKEERDMPNINALNAEKNSLIAVIESLSREENDIVDRHEKSLKNLKSTREQRMKDAKEAGGNFRLMMAKLEAFEERIKHGKLAEILSLASSKEGERLSEPHKFEDGMVDCPILNSEVSIKLLERQKEFDRIERETNNLDKINNE